MSPFKSVEILLWVTLFALTSNFLWFTKPWIVIGIQTFRKRRNSHRRWTWEFLPTRGSKSVVLFLKCVLILNLISNFNDKSNMQIWGFQSQTSLGIGKSFREVTAAGSPGGFEGDQRQCMESKSWGKPMYPLGWWELHSRNKFIQWTARATKTKCTHVKVVKTQNLEQKVHTKCQRRRC